MSDKDKEEAAPNREQARHETQQSKPESADQARELAEQQLEYARALGGSMAEDLDTAEARYYGDEEYYEALGLRECKQEKAETAKQEEKHTVEGKPDSQMERGAMKGKGKGEKSEAGSKPASTPPKPDTARAKPVARRASVQLCSPPSSSSAASPTIAASSPPSAVPPPSASSLTLPVPSEMKSAQDNGREPSCGAAEAGDKDKDKDKGEHVWVQSDDREEESDDESHCPLFSFWRECFGNLR